MRGNEPTAAQIAEHRATLIAQLVGDTRTAAAESIR
jgi:hypothetical protein